MPRGNNNPLSSLYGAFTKVVGGLWSRWGGQGWSKIRTFLPSARFDWEREAGATWMNSIVALSIGWLGNRFPRPLISLIKIARNGDHIPLGRHDVIDLWKRPNKFYGRRTMEKAIGLSLIVDGNAFIYKVRDRLNRVIELWWVPHFRIMPTWPMDGSEYIDGWYVMVAGQVYHLPPEDIIHIRDGIDPENERLGLSALRACLREVVTLNYEASYTASILKNAGIPGIVIAPDDPQLRPSPEDAERIKERFQERFGIENDMAGSTAVLAGKYKVTALGFSPEQMTLNTLPLNAMGRISASTGVASMSVGLPDPNKTYSNLTEANKSSWGTIQAIQELVGNTLDDQLLPDFGLDPNVYNISYNYEMIQELQEPLDAVHARAREDFQAGLIRRNEGREMIGLEPDDSEDGDAYFPGTTQAAAPDDAMGADPFNQTAQSNGELSAARFSLPQNGARH